jgi:hypothetical protein
MARFPPIIGEFHSLGASGDLTKGLMGNHQDVLTRWLDQARELLGLALLRDALGDDWRWPGDNERGET